MLALWCLATLVMATNSRTLSHNLEEETQLVKLHFHNDHLQRSRFRRSSDGDFDLPEQLVFTVTVDNTTMAILLKISRINGANPPMYELVNGEPVLHVVSNSNRSALYQDVNTGASYIVTCEGPTQENFSLHGSFYLKENKYRMTPHHSFPTSGMHEVRKLNSSERNFGNDARLPPESVQNENRNNRTKRSSSDDHQSRAKRDIPDAEIVELLAITDESVYQSFFDSTGSKDAALKALGAYYALLVNEIDLHYLSVSMVDPSLKIRVTLAGIFYASNKNMSPWSRDNTEVIGGVTYLNANGALDRFTRYRNKWRSSFPTHDHAMAFTMKNFEYISNGALQSSGLAGVAWLSQVCRSYDTSITEDDSYRTANTAAHELGHSLGAPHDSGDCPKEDLNIMTPTTYRTTSYRYAEAQWTFSKCSVDSFRSHIAGLGTNCMRNHNFDATAFDQPLQLPGEVYSIDQQCKMAQGDSARSCVNVTQKLSQENLYKWHWSLSEAGTVEITWPLTEAGTVQVGWAPIRDRNCSNSPSPYQRQEHFDSQKQTGSPVALLATVPENGCYAGIRCDTSCGAGSYYPYYPLAGTPCGDGSKWCYRGLCVEKPEINPCKKECCKVFKKKTKCCTGKKCCRKRWGKKLPCCGECKAFLGKSALLP